MTAPATVIAFGIRPVWHADPEAHRRTSRARDGLGPGTPAPGRRRSASAAPRYDPRVPDAFDTGPGPSRAAFLLAYAAVILGGLLGAALGYGVTDIGCHGDCGSSTAVGADRRRGHRRGRDRRGRRARAAGDGRVAAAQALTPSAVHGVRTGRRRTTARSRRHHRSASAASPRAAARSGRPSKASADCGFQRSATRYARAACLAVSAPALEVGRARARNRAPTDPCAPRSVPPRPPGAWPPATPPRGGHAPGPARCGTARRRARATSGASRSARRAVLGDASATARSNARSPRRSTAPRADRRRARRRPAHGRRPSAGGSERGAAAPEREREHRRQPDELGLEQQAQRRRTARTTRARRARRRPASASHAASDREAEQARWSPRTRRRGCARPGRARRRRRRAPRPRCRAATSPGGRARGRSRAPVGPRSQAAPSPSGRAGR